MTKGLDEIISIGSDLLGFVPGLNWLPLIGNTVAGGLEGGPKGALLGGATSLIGGEAGKLIGQAGDAVSGAVNGGGLNLNDLGQGWGPGGLGAGASGAGAGIDPLGAGVGEGVISPEQALAASAGASATSPLAKDAGNQLASQVIEPGLASALGISQPSAPTAAPTTPRSTGSGGAGPGAPPGGLAIDGSTAPNIYPWAGASSPLNQALSTISSGGGTQTQPQQGAGI